MKLQSWFIRVGMVALLMVATVTVNLFGAESLQDKELFGKIVKIDKRNRAIKVDHGPTHKLKVVYWDSDTRFLFPDRLASTADLKVNAPVRVYYRDDKNTSKYGDAIANKIVFNPISKSTATAYSR